MMKFKGRDCEAKDEEVGNSFSPLKFNSLDLTCRILQLAGDILESPFIRIGNAFGQ